MMPRQMVQWRIYVYANSLYSLPKLEVPDFRDWSPDTYNRSSYDIHRIMNWVNRDVSVLLRDKGDVLALFELILDMLPQVGMRSDQFKDSLVRYLGTKTKHFVHELINFARSPYESMIAYECNVQYKARREEDYDGPSTSAEARRLGQFLSPGLHNFVEFSRRINPDDCGGFEADLQLEDENAEELNDLLLERKDVSAMMLAIDEGMVPARGFVRHLSSCRMLSEMVMTSGTGGAAPASLASLASAASSASVTAPATVAASSSVAESQPPQQQQQSSSNEPPSTGGPGSIHTAASSALANYELQMAIERSMRDEGFSFGPEWAMPPPSSGRPSALSNRQLLAANLYRIANGTPGAPLIPIPAVTAGGSGGGSGSGAGTGAGGRGTRGVAGAAAGGAASGAASGAAGLAAAAVGTARGTASDQNSVNLAVRGRLRNRLRTRTRR